MVEKWLVLGISGVTCGGKTTLSKRLQGILPNSRVISQDDYFLPEDDQRHVWIPSLNHINFDVLGSLDMEQMRKDVADVLKTTDTRFHGEISAPPCFNRLEELQTFAGECVLKKNVNVLILEGFSIFNYPPIEELCDLTYYFLLDFDECKKRRLKRVYDPPDCPGYFEECVWPEYLKQLEEVRKLSRMNFFDGHSQDPLKTVLIDLIAHLS